jgi:hypothetical protein
VIECESHEPSVIKWKIRLGDRSKCIMRTQVEQRKGEYSERERNKFPKNLRCVKSALHPFIQLKKQMGDDELVVC